MSAKTNIKTELRDKDVLCEALTRLGVNHTSHEANAKVVDYYGSTVSSKAEVTVSKYVGFERDADQNLVLVGDTHYEKGLFRNAKTAVEKVTQVYQGVKIALALEENANFEIDSSNLEAAANADEIVIVANMR